MPTPFYHLSFAHELRAAPNFPDLLRDEWPAFCLGNIAPDAQTLSGQTRLATHFFEVPLRDPTPAWQVMFRHYPELAQANVLPPTQAAFIAGYICHLALDQQWIIDIFDPIFGLDATWDTFKERLFLHNVLRIYLDRLDLPQLQGATEATLKQAQPANWLPFLTDEHLGRWRDFVAAQLAHDATSQTVAVFAARMSLAPTDFESLLQSSPDMQARIFDRLPLAYLADFRTRGFTTCHAAIDSYLSTPKA